MVGGFFLFVGDIFLSHLKNFKICMPFDSKRPSIKPYLI
ncbi:hypothetical protein predicted by Glimmer/Critica [Helicobacter pylori B8]|uniref:Uncharacterized protein n=1 Tax=Helicobacter pylori (strain B8) TaxID=693745 RepID=D7FCH3_HELP3|nr:hypothetical protein predicted by Glimmer/Critica [Helicobacter pylori B8]